MSTLLHGSDRALSAADKVRLMYNTKDSDWLNPISMQILKEAYEAGNTLVVLNQIEYRIEYYPQKDSIWLGRTDGAFCPGGWIEKQRLRSFNFDSFFG